MGTIAPMSIMAVRMLREMLLKLPILKTVTTKTIAVGVVFSPSQEQKRT